MKSNRHYQNLTKSKDTRLQKENKKIAERTKIYSDFIYWWI
ncbi:MAG: hypothetical protein ACP5FK_00785 [bacterium]